MHACACAVSRFNKGALQLLITYLKLTAIAMGYTWAIYGYMAMKLWVVWAMAMGYG